MIVFMFLILSDIEHIIWSKTHVKQVYFKATDPFSERWQTAWIIIAFWDILTFVLLCVLCYLWAPSQSSQRYVLPLWSLNLCQENISIFTCQNRYAYSGEAGEDADDEESQSLMGDVSLVKLEKKEKVDVFSLEDEPEEDKRE